MAKYAAGTYSNLPKNLPKNPPKNLPHSLITDNICVTLLGQIIFHNKNEEEYIGYEYV
jgi:hypothetical protein